MLQAIRAAGLTVNPDKCSVATTSIHYLGYQINGGQIKPQVDKVQAIRDIPVPNTKKKLRSFLGLMGYYRRFIPQFSELAAPLTDLLRKPRVVNQTIWSPDLLRAFELLKQVLCKDPVLLCPNFEKAFTVQTDASGHGLGLSCRKKMKWVC